MTATAIPDDRRTAIARRRRWALGFCFPLVVGLASGGCGCKRDPAAAPAAAGAAAGKMTAVVTLGGQPFRLEVAATEADRRLGLMYRKSMPPDAGMVFVFAREEPLQFWMRNTEIPLDIVYLDAGGKVVSVKPLAPFDETGVSSDRPAKYAIELNTGTAARVGIKPGDVLTLPDSVRAPADLE